MILLSGPLKYEPRGNKQQNLNFCTKTKRMHYGFFTLIFLPSPSLNSSSSSEDHVSDTPSSGGPMIFFFFVEAEDSSLLEDETMAESRLLLLGKGGVTDVVPIKEFCGGGGISRLK